MAAPYHGATARGKDPIGESAAQKREHTSVFDKKAVFCRPEGLDLLENPDRPMILQQIQEDCDSLHVRLKDEKSRQGKTNQDIADSTGVPIHTTNRFFSGALANPSVFHVMAICMDLGVSLDGLFGFAPDSTQKIAENAAEIAELNAEIANLNTEIAHKDELLRKTEAEVSILKDQSRVMDRGLRERERHIRDTSRIIKPLIYGLVGLCIMLASVMLVYIVLDARDPTRGLIRRGNVSPVVWIGILGLVVLVIMSLHFTVSRWYRDKAKDKGEKQDVL